MFGLNYKIFKAVSIKLPVLLNVLVWNFLKSLFYTTSTYYLRKKFCFIYLNVDEKDLVQSDPEIDKDSDEETLMIQYPFPQFDKWPINNFTLYKYFTF